MLTNEDINIIKALLYASKDVPDSIRDTKQFSALMDDRIAVFLNHVRPTQFLKD